MQRSRLLRSVAEIARAATGAEGVAGPGDWASPVLVGYPFAGGQGKDGVDKTPLSLFQGNEWSREKNRVLVNLPDDFRRSNKLSPMQEMRGAKAFSRTLTGSYLLYRTLAKLLQDKERVVTLGGDHSMALGTVAAALRTHPDLHVLWFDAHADINRPQDSGSGNMHGQPLAFLSQLDPEACIPWLPRDVTLALDRLHYIGIRDLDPFERQVIETRGIDALSAESVNRQSVAELRRHLDSRIPVGAPVHVSFDVDCLDPSLFPCTGTPVSDGVQMDRALELLIHLRDRHNLVSVDFTEVNLALGGDVDRAKSLITLEELFKVFF